LKTYEEFFNELSITGIPKRPFFTVVQLNNGHVYTIEADSTEELYEKVSEIEVEAIKQGLL
jgi:uncharacterized protein YlzI (FlbEa/FlbD family)